MEKKEIEKNVWLSVIAGGKGTRLWPFSNKNCPKQFCLIDGENTFLQATIARFLKLGISPKHVLVTVVDELQEDLATKQTEKFKTRPDEIAKINENFGYAGAMWKATDTIREKNGDAIVLHTPSDQYIDGDDFERAVSTMLDIVKNGYPAAIGIKVTEKEKFKELGNLIYDKGTLEIKKLIEKPKTEEEFAELSSSNFAVNTGIVAWHVNMLDKVPTETPKEEIETKYLFNNILIKKGVKFVLGDFEWCDCGTFKTFYDVCEKKIPGSVVCVSERDNIICEGCSRTLIMTDANIELNVYDASDVSIVAKEIDGKCYIEIADITDTQGIKDAIGEYQKGKLLSSGMNNTIDIINRAYKQDFKPFFINVSGYTVTANVRKKGTRTITIRGGVVGQVD